MGDFSSSYTDTLPALLKQLNCSLVISTYQAGKVIIAREDGGTLNTHFRVYDRPMGIAAQGSQLAVGSHHHIHEFRNMPDVAAKLAPAGKHDACYVPKSSHVTGNIDIHEMEYASDNRLWFINTRFSCLCTMEGDYSFNPQWKPPFISHYAPEDRCHLNGLAMRGGAPRYVSALGTSNQKNGWRENKACGGMIMDLQNDEIILEGLSMPHSPRWHGNNLWLLESGKGTVNMYKANEKRLLTVAELPGFTRGLDFIGEIAFVGLSQLRESALSAGLEIAEKYSEDERSCGVWAVNLRTGQVLGFLKFEGAVQEIFAVKVLPNESFPDILEDNDELAASAYVLPDDALKRVAR